MAMQPYDNSALPQENSWRLPSDFKPSTSGGVISVDTIEQLRSEGVSNKAIASYMSGSSKGFNQNYSNVKKSYGDTEDAAKSFLNYRFYGDVNYQKPTVEEKKQGIMSFPARTIDNVYEGWKRSAMEMGKTEEKAESGEIGNINQYASQFGDSALAVGKGLAAPWTEAFNTKAFNTLPSITDIATPIVGGIAEPLMQSDIAQEQIIPAAQKYMEYSEQKPSLQSANKMVVGGGSLALGIMGINPMLKTSHGIAGAVRHPITTATQTLPTQAGKLTGQVLGIPKNAYAGIKQGLGYGKTPASVAGKQLGGKTAEFVAKGGDARFANDLATMNEAERVLAKRMTQAAEKAARTTLRGTDVPKTIAGEQLLMPAKHIIEHKQAVGKALRNVADSMAGETVDFTDDAAKVFQAMSDKGVVFSRDTGKIISAAGVPDSELPLLQKMASFFQPDDTGRVIRDFRDAHLFRQKIFKEIDAAKAALAPTAQGQSVFDVSEGMANQARGMMISRMSEMNRNYGVYSGAYKDLVSKPADFYKLIGYKGNLDNIDVQALGAGERAMRTLGHSSAESKQAIDKMIDIAERYGYQSGVDPRKLVGYVSDLEAIYPITAPQSLGGQVGRASPLEIGVTSLSPKKAVGKAVSEKVHDMYLHWKGMTLENRTKLLLELLDESPDASLVTVAEKALPRADYKQFIDDVNRDVKVSDVDVDALAASVADDARTPLSQSISSVPPSEVVAPQSAGATRASAPQVSKTSVKSPTTLPQPTKAVNSMDDFARLTPEESATGLIGGSDNVDDIGISSVTDAQRAMADGADNLSQVSIGQKAEAARALTDQTVDGGKTLKAADDFANLTPEEKVAYYPMSKFVSEPGASDILPYTGAEKIISKSGNIERWQGEHGSFRYLYRDEGGKIIGAVQGVEGRGKSAISNIYVEPSLRRQGIGTKLFDAAKKDFPNAKVADTLTEDGSKFFPTVSGNKANPLSSRNGLSQMSKANMDLVNQMVKEGKTVQQINAYFDDIPF